ALRVAGVALLQAEVVVARPHEAARALAALAPVLERGAEQEADRERRLRSRDGIVVAIVEPDAARLDVLRAQDAGDARVRAVGDAEDAPAPRPLPEGEGEDRAPALGGAALSEAVAAPVGGGAEGPLLHTARREREELPEGVEGA